MVKSTLSVQNEKKIDEKKKTLRSNDKMKMYIPNVRLAGPLPTTGKMITLPLTLYRAINESC